MDARLHYCVALCGPSMDVTASSGGQTGSDGGQCGWVALRSCPDLSLLLAHATFPHFRATTDHPDSRLLSVLFDVFDHIEVVLG